MLKETWRAALVWKLDTHASLSGVVLNSILEKPTNFLWSRSKPSSADFSHLNIYPLLCLGSTSPACATQSILFGIQNLSQKLDRRYPELKLLLLRREIWSNNYWSVINTEQLWQLKVALIVIHQWKLSFITSSVRSSIRRCALMAMYPITATIRSCES